MIKILKQIWAVTKVSARSNLAYPGEVLGPHCLYGCNPLYLSQVMAGYL